MAISVFMRKFHGLDSFFHDYCNIIDYSISSQIHCIVVEIRGFCQLLVTVCLFFKRACCGLKPVFLLFYRGELKYFIFAISYYTVMRFGFPLSTRYLFDRTENIFKS